MYQNISFHLSCFKMYSMTFNTLCKCGLQRILPSEWILHPDYSWKNNDHDVAIIRLETPATFSDTVITLHFVTILLHVIYSCHMLHVAFSMLHCAQVRPVCLPSPTTDYDSRQATVTGGGTTAQGGLLSSLLQKVIIYNILYLYCDITVPYHSICLNTGSAGCTNVHGVLSTSKQMFHSYIDGVNI